MISTNILKIRAVRSGFSLIEIVIAVLIMGIIGAVVGPMVYQKLKNSAKIATEATLRAIKDGIDEYHVHTGHYPARLEDLLAKPANVPANKWQGPYIALKKGKEVPEDAWEHEIVYHLTRGGSAPYELYSWGPNAKDGEAPSPDEWIHA